MTSLYFFLFSTIFFMLVIGAIFTQLYKQQIAIARRTVTYFGIEEGNMKREKKVRNSSNKKNLLFLQKIKDKVKYVIEQKMPASKKKELEQRLREAGYPLDMSPIDFRFFQLLIGAILFLGLYVLLLENRHKHHLYLFVGKYTSCSGYVLSVILFKCHYQKAAARGSKNDARLF